MKHLITLGMVITVFSSTFIALPNLIAESRGSLESIGFAVGRDIKSHKQKDARSLIRYESPLNGPLTKSGSKSLQHRTNQNTDFNSRPSKLNHRKLMSALFTLSILARGN